MGVEVGEKAMLEEVEVRRGRGYLRTREDLPTAGIHGNVRGQEKQIW